MSNLKRNNTLRTLKRSNTVQSIKRAGTGAWKWLNAEDANINEYNQTNVSYFQRSNTYKRLNSSNSLRYRPGQQRPGQQRPVYNQQQSYSNNYSYQNNNYQNNNQSYTVDINNGSSSSGQYVYPNQRKNNYSYNIPEDEIAYTGIKKPEPAAEKYEKGDTKHGPKKDSKIPSVLYDPEVRKQLEQLKEHKPYFMYIVTIIQIMALIFSIYKDYTATGKWLAPLNENPMVGPSAGTLINMGARFLPCMKETEFSRVDSIQCPAGIKGKFHSDPSICSLADYCGFGMKSGEKPNQWYRFLLPIFLHGGIAHLFFNLTFQIRTGVQMEKDFGTWRIIVIYLASGIFGFAFEAKSMPTSPSVGCSGALYGLMACLFIDLIQSWKLIVKPWKELIKMILIIIFSLGIGLLPFIDNYAHFGGFIMGILTGLIFLPSIIFSKRDLKIKRFLMLISVFVSVFLFVWVFRQFYVSSSVCKWCKYLNCVGKWCNYDL